LDEVISENIIYHFHNDNHSGRG